MVSTFPPLAAEEIARHYPPHYYGARNRRFNAVFERLVEVFRRRRARKIETFIPRGRVLDVGCGRGILLGLLRARGWETSGVEFNDTAAEHARAELGLSVSTGGFLEASLPDRPFDVVVLWHVLEHLPHPVEALRRCREIVRPGGLLVVAVPNLESLQAKATGRSWFHLDVPRHYFHFRLRVLRRLVEEAGFQVEEVSHFTLEQNPYGWIQSLLDLLGFPPNLLYEMLKDPSARSGPLRLRPLEVVAMALALLFVVPLGLLLFFLETAIRRGGTVEVYATANEPEAPSKG